MGENEKNGWDLDGGAARLVLDDEGAKQWRREEETARQKMALGRAIGSRKKCVFLRT